MTPTVAHCVCSLPPEGAAAPAARQSRFRGPCLRGKDPHGRSLRVLPAPPRGPLRLRPGKAGSAAPACVEKIPTVAHCVCSLPLEGAAAPAARQSRFRGPNLKNRGLAAS